MPSLGSAIQGVLHDLNHGDGPDHLRLHPGCSLDVFRDGFARTGMPRTQMEDWYAQFNAGSELCESPIERELLAALFTGSWGDGDKFAPRIFNLSDPSAVPCDVMIVPQMQVGRFRLDFGITYPRKSGGCLVAVECDGAEFHEAEKDRRRDHELAKFGVPVYRVTGSEIRRDPIAFADAIIELVRGWAANE